MNWNSAVLRTAAATCFLAILLPNSSGQSNKPAPLPGDIDPSTLTRLPRVQRQDLDAEGQKIYDSFAGPHGARPPAGILGMAVYNPELAQALHLLHDSVTKDGTLGNHTNEVAILVATREERMSLNEVVQPRSGGRESGRGSGRNRRDQVWQGTGGPAGERRGGDPLRPRVVSRQARQLRDFRESRGAVRTARHGGNDRHHGRLLDGRHDAAGGGSTASG